MSKKSAGHAYYIEILSPRRFQDDEKAEMSWNFYAPIPVKTGEPLSEERLRTIKAACDKSFINYRIVRSSEWIEESYL